MNIQQHALQKPSLFHRLFRRPYRPNLLIEFRNMIASHDIGGISADQVADLETKYGCRIVRTSVESRARLYEDVLSVYLSDQRLSERERENLGWLRETLGLSHLDAQRIREKKLAPIFRRNAENMVSDDALSDEQKRSLDELADAIALPEDVANRIYAEVAEARIKRFLAAATADQQLPYPNP